MSVVLRNRYLGSPIETRVSGFTNETILTRYSDEFDIHLRKHYGLNDQGCQFFMMHKIADEEHTGTPPITSCGIARPEKNRSFATSPIGSCG